MNETIVDSTMINLKVFPKNNNYDIGRTDTKAMEHRSKSDDIIVKELLDVQAATIGTKKLDNVLGTNSNMKHNQSSSPERLHSEVANVGESTSTTNLRRDNLGKDKGNLNQSMIFIFNKHESTYLCIR